MNWIETDVTDFHGFKNRLRSGKARGRTREWMEGAGTEGTCFLLGGGRGEPRAAERRDDGTLFLTPTSFQKGLMRL